MNDDRDILELLKTGDDGKRKAFGLLADRYTERLYWHIRNMVVDHDNADDVLQNTYIKAWNGLDGFRGESGLYTWLYRIATNEAVSFLKSRRITSFFSLKSYSSELEKMIDDDSGFDGDEAMRKFHKAVHSLPERQKSVFVMKYFDEMTYEDISEVTGVSVGALKASYHIAVQKIRKKIMEI